MKINIKNAAEAGMPEEMVSHCIQLLESRIMKIMTTIPEPGTDLEILYSDKDPLGTTDEVDDEAYFIYFVVDSAKGSSLKEAEIELELVM